MGTSTFAEYTVMPEIALAVVSPDAPADRACVFACGLSTGLGAAINTAGVEPGSTVVVFGAGLVGLGAVAGRGCRAPSGSCAWTCRRSGWRWRSGQGATDTLRRRRRTAWTRCWR